MNVSVNFNSLQRMCKNLPNFSVLSVFLLHILLFVLFGCQTGYSQTPDASGIVYVKKGSTGNGSSWTSPAGELADALKEAKTNSAIKQIWVSKGIYYPLYSPQDGANFGTDKGRDNAFLLVKDVKIYGGFDPDNNIKNLADKRIVPSATTGSILSGDFSNNDVVNGSGSTLTITGNTENAYHVVVSTGNVGTALLDGFTITGGNADSNEGVIKVNSKDTYRSIGGGLFISASAPTFSNVVICKNATAYNGGGMVNFEAAKPVFVNALIIKNLSPSNGGAGYNTGLSKPVFRNTVIAMNKANRGGAFYIYDSRTAGGYSTPEFYNSVVYSNSSSSGGALYFDNYYSVYAYISRNSLIQNETSTSNGNINGNTDPKFTNAANDNYTLASGSPLINKGNNSYVTEPGDLAGNTRIRNTTVDIGAYEVQSGGTTAYTKTNPTLSGFADINKTYGDGAFTLITPVSTSSGTFTYTSSNAAVATISGNIVTIKGAGTATIMATQAATAKHNSGSITLTLNIGKADPVISGFTDINKFLTDENFTLTPPASNSNGAFSYDSSDSDIATIIDNTVSINGVGITTITATQAETANYNSGTITLTLTVTEKTLPVSLLSFTARVENSSAKLEWATTAEQNNKGFIVYRSGNEEQFVKIGNVPASHISHLTSQIYIYTDKEPLNGNNYYKLVQVDNEGKETDLGVRPLVFSLSALDLNLYPNPTKDELNISFNKSLYNRLTISDIGGKILQDITIQPDENHKKIYLGNYPAGTYFIRISGNKGSKTGKVLKF